MRAKNVHLCSGIPQECRPVLERCVTNKLIDYMPDQLTVNQYESGQGEGLQLCDMWIYSSHAQPLR